MTCLLCNHETSIVGFYETQAEFYRALGAAIGALRSYSPKTKQRRRGNLKVRAKRRMVTR